jgi:hypothetical protein
MPGRIFVEYYNISEPSAYAPHKGHLLLVYEDEYGQEFVIRGGQKDESPLGTIKGWIADQFMDDSFGPILVDAGVRADASRDYMNRKIHDTKATRRELTTEELGWRDPTDIWQSMTARAYQIQDQNVTYHIDGPNSNSTVASVLDWVGINADSVLPEGTTFDQFPGLHSQIEPQETLPWLK